MFCDCGLFLGISSFNVFSRTKKTLRLRLGIVPVIVALSWVTPHLMSSLELRTL